MDLTKVIQGLKAKSQEYQEQQLQDGKESTGVSFKCSKCKDIGFIEVGINTYRKCECRLREELLQKFKNAGVNLEEIKDIEEYEIYNALAGKGKLITEKFINEYKDIKKDRKNGITFMGQAGSGKTFLSLFIAKKLIEKGFNVRYMSYLEAIRELKSLTLNRDEYDKKFNEYVNCDVLIIDDLFKNKILNGQLKNGLTEADLNHIMPVINQRYINHKSMVISTECRANQLIELDGATGGRILEASKYTVTFDKGCNYRLISLLKKGI